MKQFSYVVQDAMGIHARPAGQIVKLAKELKSQITIEKDGNVVGAKRLLALMKLNVLQGEKITISAEGEQENEDLQRMEVFFRENL